MIGVSALTWEDVSEAATPALWRALGQGASAAGMVTRSVRVGSCPAEGWLALGAGGIAGEVAPGALSDTQSTDPGQCAELAEPAGAAVPNWDQLTAAARAGRAAADLGALSRWLAEAGVKAQAIGPGAALALAADGGRLDSPYLPAPAPAAAAAWGDAVAQALADGAAAVIVDAGSAAPGPGEAAASAGAAGRAARAARVAQLDGRVGAILAALGRGSADGAASAASVLIASLSNPDPALGVVLELDPSAPGAAPAAGAASGSAGSGAVGLIRSSTTRTAGLVSSLDLTRVLEARLRAQAAPAANPWERCGVEPSPARAAERLREADRHAQAARRWAQFGWTATVLFAAAGMLAPLLALARRRPAPALGRRAGAAALEGLALAAGAFPAAGFAANAWPWWRAAWPPLAWLGAAGVGAGGIVLIAVAARRVVRCRALRSPLGAPMLVGLISAAIMLAGPLAGGLLTRDGPLGYATLLGARFFGYPNAAFAVLAVGALLATALGAAEPWRRGHARAAAALVAGGGLVTVLALGYPGWGADLGGAAAAAIGFAAMGLAAANRRWSWGGALLVAAAGLAAGAAAIVWDYSRGPARWTHLGAFADTVLGGGLFDVLARKGAMWLRLSAGPGLALVLLGLGVAWLARRGALAGLGSPAWQAMPLRRALAWGAAAVLAAGSLVNDSGLVVAAAGLAVAGPLAAAALTRAANPPDREPCPAPGARGPRTVPSREGLGC
ncbi:MAG: hypothetical protein LBD51_02910 [Bifidobacteriaceae bacterium]|nr:hypothetical protein [Bifidobacteriaceae bacterium]